MDFTEIRRRVIVAMFSDDVLFDRLVLKGGNALELIHRVLTRGSIDVDLSIDGEFTDVADTRERIFRALRREFESAGYVVFDETFAAVPPEAGENTRPWLSGYYAEFKLAERDLAESLGRDLEKLRRQAQTIDPQHRRKFRIELSRFEYCGGKIAADLDGRTIYVYTEEMCVLEKLRAICQQMPDYERAHPTPRARDFYDIYATITRRGLDLSLPENLDLVRHIFDAKRVPLLLLARIGETREFHRPDWDAVKDAVHGETLGFDVYFDFVLEEVAELKALWNK